MAWTVMEQTVAQWTGVPCVAMVIPHHGKVSLEWVNTTYLPFVSKPQPDFAKTYKLARGILNLDTQRNELARYALEEKSMTHILWVDTDMICENPQDVNQAIRLLLGCNTSIVSGLYRSKKAKGYYPYCMMAKNPRGQYGFVQTWTGNFIKVDLVGFGFCLIRREVFEKIPEPWFLWEKREPSEDFYFCMKAAEHGYEVKVFTDVKLSHAGEMKVLTDGSVHVLDV